MSGHASGAPGGRGHEFPCLDGLRGLAAAAVVVTHCAFVTGGYTAAFPGPALARLDVAVAVFFVLAGFLLSLPMFRAAAGAAPPRRTAAYLWRRALRILPAYWAAVAVALLLLPANRDAGPADWARQLGLLQIYGPSWTREGLSHTWSLCTEVAFYLLLPVLVRWLVRVTGPGWHPGRVLAGLGVLTAAGTGWLLWVESDAQVVGSLNLWLPTFAGWFCAGMALAVVAASPGRFAAVGALAASPGTCWAVAGALFWIACTPVAGPLGLTAPEPAAAVVKNLLFLGTGALLVLPLVLGDQTRGRLRAALAGRPARWLGTVSYGLFLFHMSVLVGFYAVTGWTPFTGGFWPALVVAASGGLLLAALSHRVLERPLMSALRDLVPERTPAGTGSTAASTAATATAQATWVTVEPVGSAPQSSAAPAVPTPSAAVPASTADRRAPASPAP
ncbi:MAG TPA: acyltransferase [Pseudonocardia sp.]|nr:acyltransferase [Pseudonocardia sp.]